MKTIGLRHQEVSLDELLGSLDGDAVRITSKWGQQFILEAEDALESEAKELGRSETILALLAGRSAEPGRTALADLEARLAGAVVPNA